MDDIFIQIPTMQAKAARLQVLYNDIYPIIVNLWRLKNQLSEVWVDDTFMEFEQCFESQIKSLNSMRMAVGSIAGVCNTVCTEYQAADNQIMSMI